MAPIHKHFDLARLVVSIQIDRRTLGAGHDLATVWSNINAGDSLIMTLKFIFKVELVSSAFVKFNIIVSGYC